MTKRIFITSILLTVLLYCKVNASELNTIRETFFKASYDEQAYLRLKMLLQKKEIKDITLQKAYVSALNILSAKYETKIWFKIEQIKLNSSDLNLLITKNPENLELHFLRYALEWHIPFYVFIERHNSQDKNFIINNIEASRDLNLSHLFTQSLYNFLIQTEEFEHNELNNIHKNLFYTTQPQK